MVHVTEILVRGKIGRVEWTVLKLWSNKSHGVLFGGKGEKLGRIFVWRSLIFPFQISPSEQLFGQTSYQKFSKPLQQSPCWRKKKPACSFSGVLLFKHMERWSVLMLVFFLMSLSGIHCNKTSNFHLERSQNCDHVYYVTSETVSDLGQVKSKARVLINFPVMIFMNVSGKRAKNNLQFSSSLAYEGQSDLDWKEWNKDEKNLCKYGGDPSYLLP